MEVQWKNIKECVLDNMSSLDVDSRQESKKKTRITQKLQLKWMNGGIRRMSTEKKKRRTTEY